MWGAWPHTCVVAGVGCGWFDVWLVTCCWTGCAWGGGSGFTGGCRAAGCVDCTPVPLCFSSAELVIAADNSFISGATAAAACALRPAAPIAAAELESGPPDVAVVVAPTAALQWGVVCDQSSASVVWLHCTCAHSRQCCKTADFGQMTS